MDFVADFETSLLEREKKMTKFIGRTEYLKKLDKLLEKSSSSLVVVTGRRRIGKSRLIKEFGKNHRLLSFEGIAPHPRTTRQSQLDEFGDQLGKVTGHPSFSDKNWNDYFARLIAYGKEMKEGWMIILLDEISWMGSKDPAFIAKLKSAWEKLSENPKIILILCGSDSSWIMKNVIQNTAFFGRRDLHLSIKEMPLKEINEFWGKNHVSAYEKFKIISITGGIPKYLELIIPSDTAEENIKRLCFDSSQYLFKEFNSLFDEQFNKKNILYKSIVKLLVGTSLSYTEVANALKKESGGTLTSHLQDLCNSGFLRREPTWSLKTGIESKLSLYRLTDNYLRFYLKYIDPLSSQIERGPVNLPNGWDSIMGLQFENMIINNRQELFDLLEVKKVVNDGPYFQTKTRGQEGCQIDYLIQTEGCFYVCEVKFSKNPIGMEVVEEMKKKIRALNTSKDMSLRPVLIHVNGTTRDLEESDYFTHIIDFSKILNPSGR
ncbi:MAG: ATP-binding protein [Alphaproteobacteria bacterium]